MANIDQS